MNSIKLNNFKFFTNPPWDERKVFRALIPSSIANSDELHKFYASLLQIGGYYGHNWDALDEVIQDLEWVEEKEVEILHDGLPRLSSEELIIYLSILSEAVDFWNGRGINAQHKLVIYFPLDSKEQIEKLTS
jgi:RNAse (barnase) inhibitor barstar